MSFDADQYTSSVLAYSSGDGSTIYSDEFEVVLDEGRRTPSSTSLGQFLLDVRTSETKEEMLVLLANVSNRFGHENMDRHDEEMKNGTANNLVEALHRLILLSRSDSYDASSNANTEKKHNIHQQTSQEEERYRSKLDPTRELQATVITTAIEMVFECSEEVLRDQCPLLYEDLAPTLPRLVTIIANQIQQEKKNRNRSSSTTVSRLMILNNCIRIIRRVGRYMQKAVIAYVCSLLLLLEQQLPSDVRVDAACAVTSFVDLRDEDFPRKDDLLQVVEDNSSMLISIISTGAMANAQHPSKLSECLDGLIGLAHTSSGLRSKLLKRRCVILVIRANLLNPNPDCQNKTLDLCSALLIGGPNGNRALQLGASPSPVFDNNSELLTDALIKATIVESDDVNAKITMMSLLSAIINKKAIFVSNRQVHDVMVALHGQAFGNNGTVAIEASVRYLEAMARVADSVGHDTKLKEALSNVVDFTTSPYAKVRAAAFECLNDLSFWSVEAAQIMINNEALLDNVSYIMTHGSNQDCSSAMNLCKQLLFHDRSKDAFCKHGRFLARLVRLVTDESISNRAAYINAVAILLDVMMSPNNEDNHQIPKEFEKFKQTLLPWLVKFANRTSDEDLKKRVVATIIRFSSSLLKNK